MKAIKQCDRRGMTLSELMIALAIFGVIMTVLFGFLTGARDSYSDTRERAQYQQSMRAVMSLVSREIRSTGCDPNEVGFDYFAVADAGQLQCRMDLNGDSDFVDVGPDENISYTFVAGDLIRNNGTGDQVILRGVQALNFTYFDAAGNPLATLPLSATDRALVRFVGIDIQGQTDRGEPVTYITRIALRNG
ncbi:MAG: prepilin-type N-terminal cleavage/methylation domain-containing protein [Candidatus Krumholzibacteriota bacterium]